MEAKQDKHGNKLQAYFLKLIQTATLSHAYAFTGPNQVLKDDLVTYLLQNLVCENNQSGQACQSCQACLRIVNNQFPDVFYLMPEGQSIKVDQIRELKDWLSTSPVEAAFKMAVIRQADLMNASASNALLTFLEEPVDNVYMILMTPDFDKLLPTIQSRVQEIICLREEGESGLDFQADMSLRHRQVLAGLPIEVSQALLLDYQAQDFETWLNQLDYYYRLLSQSDSMAFVVVQTHLKPYLTGKQALASLEYLWRLNYSVLKSLTHKQVSQDFESYFIEKLLNETKHTESYYIRLDGYILDCKQRILANVSPQLAFEQLAIRVVD